MPESEFHAHHGAGKRIPDCSWAFCFAFLVLSACGDSPEQIGAKRALTAFLPAGDEFTAEAKRPPPR